MRKLAMGCAVLGLIAVVGCNGGGGGGGSGRSVAGITSNGISIVTSGALPEGYVGAVYTATFAAQGGAGTAHVWSVSTGAVPTGLAFSSAGRRGEVGGTPQSPGSFAFSLEVTDSDGLNAVERFTIDIKAQLELATTSLPPATLGEAYDQAITATGGSGTSYQYSILSGTLPAGLTLTSAHPAAALTGTPTATGRFPVSIEVRDSAGNSARRDLTLVVNRRWLVWHADTDQDERYDLWALDTSARTQAPAVRLNAQLPSGGDVSPAQFQNLFKSVWSPDGLKLAYIADQTQDERFELWFVDMSGAAPSTAARVNGTLPAAGDVREFQFSKDGQQLLYTADQDADEVIELYVADVSGATPGAPRKVNGRFTANGDVHDTAAGLHGFGFSPDGSKITYLADQDLDSVIELYVVDARAPGASLKVNRALPAGRRVHDYAWSPDSEWLLVRADLDTDNVEELYLCAADTPGNLTKINGVMVTGGDVPYYPDGFGFSPDSRRIVYCADQDQDDVVELFTASVNGGRPSAPTKLSGTMTGRAIKTFQFAPSGDRLVFHGDRDVAGQDELFLVDLAAGTAPVKLNGALPATAAVRPGTNGVGYHFSPDGSKVAYIADQGVAGDHELFVVDVSGAAPQAAVKLSGPLPQGATAAIDSFFWRPDSRKIAFTGDQRTRTDRELFLVDLASPGSPIRLNGQMQHGDGDVGPGFSGHSFSTDGQRLCYVADQENDAVFELYLVDLSGALPGNPVKVSRPAPVANGDVTGFAFAR